MYKIVHYHTVTLKKKPRKKPKIITNRKWTKSECIPTKEYNTVLV